MKLFIGVPTSEMGKQAIFYDYFDNMKKPMGTIIIRPHAQSPAAGRNLVIDAALKNDATHILFIDDDTIPPVDIVEKLARWDKDMVTGVYCMRNSPHYPIIFEDADEQGRCLHYNMDDAKSEGLVKLRAAGLGACLIKTEVFRGMEAPWIRLGELDPENWCDDIGFFHRAYLAGFELYADLSVRSGHMATTIVSPDFRDGKWVVTYKNFGTEEVGIRMPRRAEVLANV